MTDTLHTPGPWEARPYNADIERKWYINGPEPIDQFLADVYERHPIDGRGSGRANAQLMAAAPDLLAALKEIEQHDHNAYSEAADGADYATGVADGHRCAANLALAAIALAQ